MAGLFGGNSPMTFPQPTTPPPPPLPTGWNWVGGTEGVRGTATGPGPFPYGGRGGLAAGGPGLVNLTQTPSMGTLAGGTKTAGYG